ncbi:MAG: tetratricopeptide repeat protein [Anaerolineae bacterium]|nr:tetratricopeptide repeat protein [Anaerolineae bacterium]
MTRRLLLVVLVLIVLGGLVFMPGVQAQSSSACDAGVDYLMEAQAHVSAEAYDVAQAYACALEADPVNDQAHIGRLQAAILSGDYLTAYGEVFLLSDGVSAALEVAIMSQTDLLAEQPDYVPAYQTRALLALFAGQPDVAQADADAILNREPDSAFAHVIQAGVQAMMGDPEGAAASRDAAFETALEDAQLHGLAAAVAFLSFDIEGMAAHSNRAIELAPDLAYPYRIRGLARMFSGNPEDAVADAEQAISLDPTYYGFYMLRASAYLNTGDPVAALADLNAAIARNPRTLFGHGLRSYVRLALGEIEAAAQDFATMFDLRTTEIVEADALISDEPVVVPMTAGRAYHLPFEAQAGQSLTITVNSVNPDEVDPMMLVVSPDELPLVFNDDASEETLDAIISDYTVSESGTYILLVSHAAAGSEGDIEIEVDVE